MRTRISVNKLGEYLEANPSRRKKIVFDQKNPVAFKTTRYSRAKDIAIEYFENEFNDEIIVRGIDELENAISKTDFQENDLENSIYFFTIVR